MSAVGTAPGVNLATAFLDRNVTEGRGARTALTGPAGSCTYSELSALSNRVGNAILELGVQAHERVLLALADSVEFVATWYAVQKIGAVTAEVYTFLQPKDYQYYLDYTAATVVVVDMVTLDRMREASAASRARPRLLVVGAATSDLLEGEVSFDALVSRQPDDLDAAADRAGRHRDLEVHHREHRHTEGVRPHRAEPDLQPPGICPRRARHPRRRRRPAGAEALLRLCPRPRGAVPVRRRRDRRDLRRQDDARARVRADRAAPTDDPGQRADHDAGDARSPQRRVPGPELPAPVHVGRRGPARTPPSPLGRGIRRRGPRRHRIVRGVSHLHLEPARPRSPGDHRRGRPRLPGRGRRRGWASARRRSDRPALGQRGERRRDVLAGCRRDRRDLRRWARHERGPRGARRRRVLHVSRQSRRPAQGGRDLGCACRDRALPRRPPRRGRMRGGGGRTRRADVRPGLGGAQACFGDERRRVATVRPRAPRASQGPARGAHRGRAAADRLGQDRSGLAPPARFDRRHGRHERLDTIPGIGRVHRTLAALRFQRRRGHRHDHARTPREARRAHVRRRMRIFATCSPSCLTAGTPALS